MKNKKGIVFYFGMLMFALALTGCTNKTQNNNDADYTFAEKESTAEELSEITSADTTDTTKLVTTTATITNTAVNTTIKETTKTTTKTTRTSTAQTTKITTAEKNRTAIQTNDDIQWNTGTNKPILTTVPVTVATVPVKISDDYFTETTDYIYTDEELDSIAEVINDVILTQLAEQGTNIAYLDNDFVFDSLEDTLLQVFELADVSISGEQFDILIKKVNALFHEARIEAVNNELGTTFERIDDNTVKRIYTYLEVNGEIWNNTTELLDSEYEYWHQKPRYKDMSEWVNYIYENEVLLDKIANAIMSTQEPLNKTKYQILLDTISFVQSIPYELDIDSTGYEEFPKYPYETLYENCGDCEDVSILLAGLLRSMGYGVCLVHPTGHMAVGVRTDESDANFYMDGLGYYYIECTNEGWLLGEVPKDYIGDAKAYHIN
ncbi:MAG: hypothetical protein K2J26_06460 [Ruminococcus sp.]|nr:hypothetical protein [Ruminococcus sp.]